MVEVGIDISGHIPRKVTQDDIADADLDVTFRQHAGWMPVIPPGVEHLRWTIQDPGELDPDSPLYREELRNVRDDIRAHVKDLFQAQ